MAYAASFANCGYIVNEFTDSELSAVWKEVKNIQNNFEPSKTIDHSFTSTVKKEYELIESLDILGDLVSV